MRTLGANNGFIKQIFIWYGLLAGMKGCLIGIVLGVVLALNLRRLFKASKHYSVKIVIRWHLFR